MMPVAVQQRLNDAILFSRFHPLPLLTPTFPPRSSLRSSRFAETAAQLQDAQERRANLQKALTDSAAGVSTHNLLGGPGSGSRQSCWAGCMGSAVVVAFQQSLNGLVAVWLYFADLISDIEVILLFPPSGSPLVFFLLSPSASAQLTLTSSSSSPSPHPHPHLTLTHYPTLASPHPPHIPPSLQVTILLHSAGFEGYAAIAGSLLVLQFVAVYFRVLPYLRSTLGRAACVYRLFLYLGFPFGMLLLDILMFLEPFGLLPIVPMPERMRQFIPAYKATRIIAEVMLESLPQCLLQSYILITVMHHVNDHHESRQEVNLLGASLGGTSFSEVLPRSITISVITMLKTWIELVYSAREAGISVRTKVAHLWHVGHGLPLDALKKGSITRWVCTHKLSDGEVSERQASYLRSRMFGAPTRAVVTRRFTTPAPQVMPLLDALIKNSSLHTLSLAEAGLEWSGPDAAKARSAAPLIEAMVLSRHRTRDSTPASVFALPSCTHACWCHAFCILACAGRERVGVLRARPHDSELRFRVCHSHPPSSKGRR